MAPTPLLADAYRKYKRGTESLVQWLAETARSTGTVDKVFSDTAIPPPGGRLKGTARKEARNAPRTCRIATRSFVTLATAIVSDKKLSVPASVLTTLRAVIRGRRECAVWYATACDSEDDAVKAENASHAHFIKTLESVLEILKAKKPVVKKVQLKTMETGLLRTGNAYHVLEEKELSGSDDIPEITEIQAKPAKTKKVTYKLEESDTDVIFAVYCFLKDVTDLRIAVRRTWREFANGDIGVQAAALTMNVALNMIKKVSDEFEAANPRFNDSENRSIHSDMIDFVYRRRLPTRQGSAFDAADGNDEPYAYNEERQMLHLDTVMCVHTTDILLLTFGKEKDEEFQLTNDEKRFLKCVTQLAASPPMHLRLIDEYMVYKAARAMLSEGLQQSWIMFSLQIFWDMQRELGPHLSVGESLLHRTGRQILEGYQSFLDFKGLEKLVHGYDIQCGNAFAYKKFIEKYIDSKNVQMSLDADEESAFPEVKPRKIPGFSLLRCDPAFCGLLLATIRKDNHELAIALASNQAHIIGMAHLYNATRCAGHLPKNLKWADMEWLIEQQGSDWIFMGKKPEPVLAIGKRAMLVMGILYHEAHKGYRSSTPGGGAAYLSRVSAPRRLRCHAQYLESSIARNPRDLTHQKVTNDLQPSKATLVKVEMLLEAGHKTSQKSVKKLSSLEKLHLFKQAVVKDETALTFDVMELFLRCIRILQQVHKYARAVAPLDYPAALFEGGIWLTNVILSMLFHLKKLKGEHPCILPVVGIMLRKMIEKEGDSVLRGAAALQESTRLSFPGFRSVDEPSFDCLPEDLIRPPVRTEFPYSMYWQMLQQGPFTS
ncbi:uncharacterized protein J4E78_009543 [Alternaria triticimaculans]|uniref:uncharacterized protein n=1 Tax=Alternaria triticimaculans TaxID=297637 RepID=UPI0020C5510B|nr:uncharacterized protein J4E78_009543 [Alternaria triticimaculans]KAI4644724.1 hypothetical protein J4E78_009543 [Alternaria triticimaculans]